MIYINNRLVSTSYFNVVDKSTITHLSIYRDLFFENIYYDISSITTITDLRVSSGETYNVSHMIHLTNLFLSGKCGSGITFNNVTNLPKIYTFSFLDRRIDFKWLRENITSGFTIHEDKEKGNVISFDDETDMIIAKLYFS